MKLQETQMDREKQRDRKKHGDRETQRDSENHSERQRNTLKDSVTNTVIDRETQ